MGAACKRCALDFKQKYIQQLIFAANLGPGQPGREGTGLHLPQKYRCAFWVSIASLVHSFGVIIVAVSNEPEFEPLPPRHGPVSPGHLLEM